MFPFGRRNKDRQFSVNDRLPYVEIVGGNESVKLVSLDIQVIVSGLHAETTQTMRFYNPNQRDLEGNLTFPMPDGAVVCGCALDIQGKMVDGVVVPKKEARRILEAEERKKVDPGIMEHVQGNVYRTRIYPIPAKGSRTIRVTYVSNLTVDGNDAAYQLPLPHAKSVDEIRLRVEVVQAPVKPEIGGGLGNMSLDRWEDRWVSEAKLAKDMPSEDLQIQLPDLPDHFTNVETGEDGDIYFCVSSRVSDETHTDMWVPERVAIAWDASGSRFQIKRDIELLDQLLGTWSKVTVDVFTFRDSVDQDVQTFVMGDGEKKDLLSYLNELPYDGGTNLAALDLTTLSEHAHDAWFLFSDGMGNIDSSMPKTKGERIFTVSNQINCNSALLQYLAQENGGVYINLLRSSATMACDAIRRMQEPLRLADVTGCQDLHMEVHGGRLAVTGRLQGDVGRIRLAGPGAPADALDVNADTASQGRLIARAWAGWEAQRIALIDDTNLDELVEIGRKYGLVTPGTSLLVLETLEQYLEYKIEPPESLPEMLAEFREQVAEDKRNKAQVQTLHIEKVVSMWKDRIEWWEKDFHAERKKYKAEEKPGGESGGPDAEGEFDELCEPETMEDMVLEEATMSIGAAPPSPAEAPAGDMDDEGAGADASIRIQPWSPETPYLKKMKKVASDEIYRVYLEQRESYGGSPAFFLDCGDYLLTSGQRKYGMRVLSNLPELGLDDPALMRMYAWRLQQAGELDMAIRILERVLKDRDDEPQSYRDLALAVGMRWERDGDEADAIWAMELFYEVLLKEWINFPEIELIVLMELNRLIHLAKKQDTAVPKKIDSRLIRLLDLDIRISMAWDTDLTDVDLHVFEPTGEHAYYGHNLTAIGGFVSRDFVQGYGPEEYVLKKAESGTYTIKTHYYGSSQQSICGACTVIVTVFTNYGRKNEKKQLLTLRLESPSDQALVGEITIGGEGSLDTPDDSSDDTAVDSSWHDQFRSLNLGMSVNQVTEKIGQPAEVQGEGDDMILVYKPKAGIAVHLIMSPRLTGVKQVMEGAKLDLLTIIGPS